MQGTRIRKLACIAALTAALLGAGAGAAQATSPPQARVLGPDAPQRSAPALAKRSGSSAIGAGRLAKKLKQLAKQAPGASGYFVKDLDAKRHGVLFDRNEGSRRKLASNEKLFTTTTALHVLGPKGRIETRVKAAGKVTGAGRLKGDLYLIGGGDPSLGASGLGELAAGVRRAGITRVKGSVIGDDSVFDRLRGVPDSNFGPSPYFAPLSGLVYGGSTYAEDPAKEAAKAFRDVLRSEGVKVSGKARQGVLDKGLRKRDPIAVHDSDSIAKLVAATNKNSDNFYAEMLLKRLDASSRKGPGTTKGGTHDVQRYAKSVGSKVSARDGSGLTAHNLSSPRDVVDLLSAVRKKSRMNEVGGPIYHSLSIAGKDGTLDYRMEGTFAAGRCRGKTGTISGVSNLSGYCRTRSGLVAFSLLMNGVGDLTGAHNIQDKMVVQIARYRR